MRKKKDKVAYVDEKITGDWKRYYVWYDYDGRYDYESWPKFETEEEAISAVPMIYNTIRIFRLGAYHTETTKEIRR